MIGLGTIVNGIAVIIGGVLGNFFGRRISKNMQDMLIKSIGIAIMFIGISGTLQHMLVIQDGNIETRGTMVLIISLILGSIIGEYFRIENKFVNMGEWIKRKTNRNKDNYFIDGFVNTTLIVCVGAMGIVGAIQDGITGNATTLYTKAILDFVVVIINSSIFGIGSAFAAIPLIIYQGSITIISKIAGNFISNALIDDISMVGATLIFCIGVNLIWNTKIKIGNMLPALLITIICYIIVSI
ncbi:DUF554 domain-containing protein [Miniphocaeibacter massiliensis]|uniref:DUF554 domain-containing protein n=1 Tax=Miniphocaeibacter massiliensis TaxID=2041841 RepID=UPI0013ECC5C3|nr:DUF554 domain-containing protein [Miniphocaeibacter massiliensis]